MGSLAKATTTSTGSKVAPSPAVAQHDPSSSSSSSITRTRGQVTPNLGGNSSHATITIDADEIIDDMAAAGKRSGGGMEEVYKSTQVYRSRALTTPETKQVVRSRHYRPKR